MTASVCRGSILSLQWLTRMHDGPFRDVEALLAFVSGNTGMA